MSSTALIQTSFDEFQNPEVKSADPTIGVKRVHAKYDLAEIGKNLDMPISAASAYCKSLLSTPVPPTQKEPVKFAALASVNDFETKHLAPLNLESEELKRMRNLLGEEYTTARNEPTKLSQLQAKIDTFKRNKIGPFVEKKENVEERFETLKNKVANALGKKAIGETPEQFSAAQAAAPAAPHAAQPAAPAQPVAAKPAAPAQPTAAKPPATAAKPAAPAQPAAAKPAASGDPSAQPGK